MRAFPPRVTDDHPSLERTGEDSHGLGTAETIVGEPGRRSAHAHAHAPARSRGELLGRYVVLDTLGRGAMGIVYAAYDPELDRKVALKLLLPGQCDRESARLRLQREAQAIAQLSHPNVIAIHDVGAVDGRVFIAMEFVDGMNLSAWLSAAPRAPARILDVFEQAGMGLAAAHAAGLVHRDFKPDNVLLGHDGRARVVDFGLVRRDEGASSPSSDHVELELDERRISGSAPLDLTGVDTMVGTPAYMSPEQFTGGSGDARSDQFSFCVSLFEALYGVRPFEGRTAVQLAWAVTRGEVRAPPARRGVPGRMHRVLLRGLAVDPAARHPGMEALLHALRRAFAPRRARWVIAGLAMAGLGGGAWAATRDDQRCAAEVERAAALWSSERRDALEQAFLAVDRPYAAPTWERVQARIDAHLGTWGELERQACERAGEPRLEGRLDARRACLDDRLRETAILLETFAQADDATVTEAIRMVRSLRSPSDCVQPRGAIDRPWPADPELRTRVQEIRDELQRIELKIAAGERHELLLPGLVALEARAEALGYEPAVAEIMHARGGVLSSAHEVAEADEVLDHAFARALRSHHDGLALEVTTSLLHLHGTATRELDRALGWGRRADALIVRVGAGEDLRIRVRNGLASAYALAGEDELALAMYDEALAGARGQDDPLALAGVLNNLGSFHGQHRRLEQARPYFEESIAITSAALGEDHPTVLRSRANLAIITVLDGKYAEGRPLVEAIAARQEAVLGPDHLDLSHTLETLGVALMHQGEIERSEVVRRRVVEIRERAYGPDHPLVIQSRSNLVATLMADRRFDEAEVVLQGLLPRIEHAPRSMLGVTLSVLEASTVLELRRERPARALALAERADALCRETPTCPVVHVPIVAVALADARLATGDPLRARALFEGVLSDPDLDSEEAETRARFGLARIAIADPTTAPAALAQVHELLDAAREGGVKARALVPDIEAWLREHQ